MVCKREPIPANGDVLAMRSSASRIFLVPALALLSGCSYNQVSAQGVTPIPQSLILAAERTSQSSMALADIMARAHGESVRSVALEVPSTAIPDFLQQRVRLDYNGPQKQVLDRVAADTGYRVVEYNEPSSGIGWQPWIRLSGDKPLIQHFKEMNSQSPWHLVLDHRDRRIVVDYSADGSMASQVSAAQRSLNNPGERKSPNLPNVSSMEAGASQQVTRNTVPAPESQSQQARPLQAAAPLPEPSWKNLLPAPGSGYWHALISGYESDSRAKEMQEWVGARLFRAKIVSNNGVYDVHIPARDDGEAGKFAAELKALGVPVRVEYMTADGASRDDLVSRELSPQSSIFTDRNDADGVLNPEAWYVQTAFVTSSDKAKQLSSTTEFDKYGPYNAYPLKGGWVLRIGPMDNRAAAAEVMREVRRAYVSDAYAVKGLNV